MGKKSKKKSQASKSPSKGPSQAPSKSGGKKRTSNKAPSGGGLLGSIQDMMQSGNLPSLPPIGTMSGSSSMKYNPRTGMIQPRRKSRKGLSASDIKGFMRVNKFAGMLTKVSGKKHHVVSKTHRHR